MENKGVTASSGGHSAGASPPSPQAVSAVPAAAVNAEPFAIALPARYDLLSPAERRAVREEYARRQDGKCYYCGGDLDAEPPARISRLSINWKLFPPNFLRWPHHLHHDHETDLTIGTVHSRCNAVLWQYHGE